MGMKRKKKDNPYIVPDKPWIWRRRDGEVYLRYLPDMICYAYRYHRTALETWAFVAGSITGLLIIAGLRAAGVL